MKLTIVVLLACAQFVLAEALKEPVGLILADDAPADSGSDSGASDDTTTADDGASGSDAPADSSSDSGSSDDTPADAASGSDSGASDPVPADPKEKSDMLGRVLGFMLGMLIGIIIVAIFYAIVRCTCGVKLGLKKEAAD